jgi:hypothetical protein
MSSYVTVVLLLVGLAFAERSIAAQTRKRKSILMGSLRGFVIGMQVGLYLAIAMIVISCAGFNVFSQALDVASNILSVLPQPLADTIGFPLFLALSCGLIGASCGALAYLTGKQLNKRNQPPT